MWPFINAEDSLFQVLIYLLASVAMNILRYLPLPRQIGSLHLLRQSALGVEPLPPLPPDPTLGLPSQLLLQAALLYTSLFRSRLQRARLPPALCIQDPLSSLLVRCAQTSSVNHSSQLTGLSRLSKLAKGNGPNSHEILALQIAFPPNNELRPFRQHLHFITIAFPSPSAHRHF